MTDPTTTPGDEQTATLLVDRTSSTCGGCGKPALPSALTHANVSGYEPKPGGGCGARFVAIRSANRAVTEEDLRCLRPDLPVDPTREQQTTGRPYTDEDLRAEAARQLAASMTDPDFMGIGEQMQDSEVASLSPHYQPQDIDGQPNDADGPTWDDICDQEQFGEAQRAIDDLLGKAADVSDWAINLGADGLEPSDEHLITVNADNGVERPIARIHFAFEPGMPEELRTAFVQGIGQALKAQL